MTRSAQLRTALTSLVLLLLLCGLSAHCLADYLVADVSREQAKELGITVHTQPSANRDLRVDVEFHASGRMKAFRWADLELTHNGKRLVTAALMARKPILGRAADTTRLEFYLDPAALPDTTITLFVADQELGGTGYRLKMKDLAASAGSL